MKALFDKLGLYDLLGYIIPGFLGIIALRVIYTEIFRLKSPVEVSNDFLNSVVLIGLSYFVGTLMHEISQFVQDHILLKIWGGFPSENILLPNNNICPAIEKSEYYILAKKYYGVETDNYSKEKSQLVFNRFRSALQKSGHDDKAELFNTYYGMYRNFFTGSLLCFITYFVYLIVYLINLFIMNNIITEDLSFIVTGGLFFICTVILYRRTRRFGETYVKYVFRGYAEYIRDEKAL